MVKNSIIIAAYNEAENIEKCLLSLREMGPSKDDHEIIVIDNNSTDGTARVAGLFPEIIYLQEKKQGASFARNKGIREAKGDVLVFLDADTTVSRHWITKITEPFDSPRTGAVGGAIYPSKPNNIVSEYLGMSLFLRYPRYGNKRAVKGYPSCNLAVRRKALDAGFDTDRFSTYGEDKDLCYRVIRSGHEVIFSPEAVVFHRHPETFKGLFSLLIKSSQGRVDFSRKYPFAPDVLIMNFHLPLLYSAMLVMSLLLWGPRALLITAAPALIYLIFASILAFANSKKLFMSFLVKPVLDIFSVYVVYTAYHVKKIRSSRWT